MGPKNSASEKPQPNGIPDKPRKLGRPPISGRARDAELLAQYDAYIEPHPDDALPMSPDKKPEGPPSRLFSVGPVRENPGDHDLKPFRIAPDDPRLVGRTASGGQGNDLAHFLSMLPMDVFTYLVRFCPLLAKQRLRMLCTRLWVHLTALAPPNDLFYIERVEKLMHTQTHASREHEYPDLLVHFSSIVDPIPLGLRFGVLIDHLFPDPPKSFPFPMGSARMGTFPGQEMINLEVADFLRNFHSRNLGVQAFAWNDFGGTRMGSLPLKIVLPYKTYEITYYYCFSENAPIHMADGTTRPVKNVRPGDLLMTPKGTPTTVKLVKSTTHDCDKKVVDMGDYLITLGHPIFVEGEWYRPDELYPVVTRPVTTLYNFYCEPEHELMVGLESPTIVSSLGHYIKRIADRDPYTDILFGSGYGTELAKRYEWLLTLKDRIPNEDVERETDKYWARVKEQEEKEQLERSRRMAEMNEDSADGEFDAPFHPTELQLESS